MSRALCEYPGHIGDRLVDRRDLCEKRIEWRRLLDQGREYTRLVRRECKACARRQVETPEATEALF